MAMTKLTLAAKAADSPVDYETQNSIIAEMKEMYDAITAKHTAAGLHDDPLLCKGWGKVTFAGGTPTLTTSNGIVSSISDQATGQTRIELSTAASSADEIHAAVTVHATGERWHVSINVVDADTFDVYTYDEAGSALGDTDFSLSVWIQ